MTPFLPRGEALDFAALEDLPPPLEELPVTDVKKCSKCGKALRADNTRGVCGQAGPCARRAAGEPPTALKRPARDSDDGVLASLGFGGGSDQFSKKNAESPPPATTGKLKRPPKPVPVPPDWPAQFRALASALGLKPEEMISDFCRDWVEHVRGRALARVEKQLPPAGVGEAA